MIIGCYDMHLYCDAGNAEPGYLDDGKSYEDRLHGFEEGSGEFTGQTESGCKRSARRAGWVFAKDGRVFCYKHSGEEWR